MFWRLAPQNVWKNSLDVRSFRRLVPAFFFGPVSGSAVLLFSFLPLLPPSSLGVGPGSFSPLLWVCLQDIARSRKAGRCGTCLALFFCFFSLCPDRLPSPSLLSFSLSLSLSLSLALSLFFSLSCTHTDCQTTENGWVTSGKCSVMWVDYCYGFFSTRNS